MLKDRTPINDEQIVAMLRHTAHLERSHQSITFEYGNEIINMVARWGDRLADALLRINDGDTKLEE